MEKKELRKKILSIRDSLSNGEITKKSEEIKERLFSLKEYQNNKNVMFFLSFGKEVRTESMVRESLSNKKKIIVPKTDVKNKALILSWLKDYDKDLAPGLWGIPEPSPEAIRLANPKEIDLVIVPGVAFDLKGNRLGYGGGFYDRFFPTLREGVPLISISFNCQIVDKVPTTIYDKKVDSLITEDNVFYFKK